MTHTHTSVVPGLERDPTAHPHLIDENLIQAENEDKITPYLAFLISAVSFKVCPAVSPLTL